MSENCVEMYMLAAQVLEETHISFENYIQFVESRDEFNFLRGNDYKVTIDEFMAYYHRPLDLLYFTMFDADLSDEVTFDEYCNGIYQTLKPELLLESEEWFNDEISNSDYLTDVEVNEFEVELYDYNSNNVVEEEEWLSALIQINEYYQLAAMTGVGTNFFILADFTESGFSEAEFNFFDVDQDTGVNFEEWCKGKKTINSFEFLLNGDIDLHDDDDNDSYDSAFDINMDGDITSEEFILGMTWWNEFFYYNEAGDPVSAGAFGDYEINL